ncbi:MAG: class I SAM-dependent rRNA methyltransferase [Planctomycetes bacterium]|nr:class I SAM-dependent rRNA methyltransferase [Planctomycetota bacterium]
MNLLRIDPKDARAIGQGHPWLYREALSERPRSLRPGAEVDLGTPEHDFVGRGIYDPSSPVAVRVWTRDRDEHVGAALIAKRVAEAVAVRERLGLPATTDAYRLVNAEGDYLPGILVDRWGEWVSITLQSDALQRLKTTIVDAVAAAVPAAGIYVRDDKTSHLVAGEPAPDILELREPTGTYVAQIAAGGKPGLFTDMREVRRALAPHLKGRSFLNLFAHTGAFSGCAAAAGAASIVSVDLSRQYLDAAKHNVELNTPDGAAPVPHETAPADVFDAMKGYSAAGRRFDVILADPPTFSSSKTSGAFNVKDGYRSIARASLRVLSQGGLFVAATNFRGMDNDAFLRTLHDAAEAERARLRVLEVHGQPSDYPSHPMVPETRHLRVAFCTATLSRDDD